MKKQEEPRRRPRPYMFILKKPMPTYPNGDPFKTQAWRKEHETTH